MADDIVDVLRSMAAAYPEDIFPPPPPERQAKDGAAAHVLRTVAVPHFIAAADEIELLRAIVASWSATRHCPQCGQGYEARACGPTHATIAAAIDRAIGA